MSKFKEIYDEETFSFKDKKIEKKKFIKKGNKIRQGTFGFEIEFIPKPKTYKFTNLNSELIDTADIVLSNSQQFNKFFTDVYKTLKQIYENNLKTRYKYREFLDQVDISKNEYWDDDLLQYLVRQVLLDGSWTKLVDKAEFNSLAVDLAIDEMDVLFHQHNIKATVGNDSLHEMWSIGRDDDLVEVRSPILTNKNFNEIKKVLNILKTQKFSGGTSAHVHIGVPENINLFDIFYIIDAFDEEEVINWAGKNREFVKFTNFKHVLINNIINIIIENETDILTLEEFKGLLQFNLENTKFYGINLLSLNRFGTIEFRYLSSQILDNIPKFFDWIDYMLFLVNNIKNHEDSITLKYSGSSLLIKGVKITKIDEDKVKIEATK